MSLILSLTRVHARTPWPVCRGKKIEWIISLNHLRLVSIDISVTLWIDIGYLLEKQIRWKLTWRCLCVKRLFVWQNVSNIAGQVWGIGKIVVVTWKHCYFGLRASSCLNIASKFEERDCEWVKSERRWKLWAHNDIRMYTDVIVLLCPALS